MNTSVGQITLIDMISSLERKELVINKDYQRGNGIWPASAKSYFIDTILEEYPFPKIYLYQVFDGKTNRPIKEVVDGQQRVTTILDFYKNKFALTSASKRYAGMKFEDLPDDVRQKFISFQVETSTIYAATRGQLLEMFRRMNAYTSPLTSAEKRHATYQGIYKWFIVEKASMYSDLLEKYNILTPKVLSRMGDAEFISELAIVFQRGIVSRNTTDVERMYKSFDDQFNDEASYNDKLDAFFNFLKHDLSDLSESFMMKSYVVHSLFCAYIAVKYGFPGSDDLERKLGFSANANYRPNVQAIIPKLQVLSDAHEMQDISGNLKDYVEACLSTTTKQHQRTVRTEEIIKAII